MAGSKFFVTGTDVKVGKTLVASSLLAAANARGLSTMGLMPVTTGCKMSTDGLRHPDALLLQDTMSVKLAYQQINPVALPQPVAPILAAESSGKRVVVSQLAGFCRGALTQKTDVTVVEGIGGWQTPLNRGETMAELAKALKLPVVMVVGINSGCINHALLTAGAISRDGLLLAGWVANHLDRETPYHHETVATLKAMLRAPCLGEIPELTSPSPELGSTHLDIDPLLSAR